MKKIIAVLLSLMMLIPAFAALPVSAEGEESKGEGTEEKLSAKFYNVTEDESWLYVVFNKPVAEPKPTDEVFLGLVGHGWPVNDPPVLRYLVRCEFNDVEAVTDTVWRFSPKTAKTDAAKKEHKEWWLYHNIPAETETASVDNWSIRLFGTITTADGSEELELDESEIMYDNQALFEKGPSYKIQDVTEDPSSYTTVASLKDLGVEGTTTEPPATSIPETSDNAGATSGNTPNTSPDDSADGSKATSGAPQDDGNKNNNIVVWAVVGAAAVIIVVVAVVVLTKKKKA